MMLSELVKNKHFVISLIVTPILAVLAFFATDYVVSEKPHKAVSGGSYPLVASSNCRYESGKCTLKNGDVKVIIKKYAQQGESVTFSLESEMPLKGAQIGLSQEGAEGSQPVVMSAQNDTLRNWQGTLSAPSLESARLQLAFIIEDVTYYGEVGTIFTEFKPIFANDQ